VPGVDRQDIDIALLQRSVIEIEKTLGEHTKQLQSIRDYVSRSGGIQAAVLGIGTLLGTVISWAISMWNKH
jgi:hypothetical protein